ncbi:MAG: class I SAM-dependent methyltransferase [Verrucomicrobiia bacterium]
MRDPADHYTGAEGRAYHHGKRGLPEEAVPWVARHRARKLQRHVNPDDVVVEFGMGWGWNLMELRAGRRIGVDLDEELLASARARGIETHASTAGLPDGFADVVLGYHVLEHVLQPATVLGELARILKPRGKLLLVAPFEKERRYRRYFPTEPNHHLYSWNVQSLGNLVRECGFTITEIGLGKYGYDRLAASLATRSHTGETGFRLLRSAMVLIRPLKEIVLLAQKLG